jgi:hypothetical protein
MQNVEQILEPYSLSAKALSSRGGGVNSNVIEFLSSLYRYAVFTFLQ